MPVKLNHICCTVMVAGCFTGIGCGDDNKTTIATKLDQPLPPPPVGSGGAGKQGAVKKPQEPTGVAN